MKDSLEKTKNDKKKVNTVLYYKLRGRIFKMASSESGEIQSVRSPTSESDEEEVRPVKSCI